MKTPERLLAFLGALLLTFGISDLNQKMLGFDENRKAYAAIFLGIFLLVIFAIRYRANKS
jgi:hypothetical protein